MKKISGQLDIDRVGQLDVNAINAHLMMSFRTLRSGGSKVSIADTIWTRRRRACPSRGAKQGSVSRQSLLAWLLAAGLAVAPWTAFAVQLTVNQGAGSGAYSNGERVFIVADPAPFLDENVASTEPADVIAPYQIFDHWSGAAVQLLEDSSSPRTSLVMPRTATNLTAIYKDAPRWPSPSLLTFVPDQAHGAIYLLHGTEGCATCIGSDVNIGAFVQNALSRGFAVVIPQNYDRDTKTWDTTPSAQNNIDMQRLAAIHQGIVDSGQLATSTSVHLLGVSGGGNFASLFSQEVQAVLNFPIASIALAVSPGESSQITTLDTPTLFALAAMDTRFSVDIGVSNFSNLVSRDIPAQLVIGEAAPLLPESFWIVDGINKTESGAVFTALKNGGFLDSGNFLVNNPKNSDWESVVRPIITDETEISQLRTLLFQAFAEHIFMDSFSNRILGFFEAPQTVVDVVPQITSFTPSTGASGALITVTGKYFVDIEAVSIGGVAVEFDQTTSTSLLAVVPPAAVAGPITISNRAGIAVSATNFGVQGPQVTSLNTNAGPVGTVVKVTGKGLVGINSVTFNGVAATFSAISATSLSTVVPAGATDGNLLISTSGGSVSAGFFNVAEGPVFTSLSTNQAKAGDTVSIFGNYLQNTSAVILKGSVSASFTAISAQEVRFTVPAGLTGVVGIRVETPYGATAASWVNIK